MASPRLQMQERVFQDFGQRLRHLRHARQLRQLDLADFGLSYQDSQRLEVGQVNPTLLTLHRLAPDYPPPLS